jgi:hypothetical protein
VHNNALDSGRVIVRCMSLACKIMFSFVLNNFMPKLENKFVLNVMCVYRASIQPRTVRLRTELSNIYNGKRIDVRSSVIHFYRLQCRVKV